MKLNNQVLMLYERLRAGSWPTISQQLMMLFVYLAYLLLVKSCK